MTERELALAPAQTVLELLRTRTVRAEALFAAQDARRQRWEPHLRAYLNLSPSAGQEARRVDAGEVRGRLAGVTLGVKDLYDVAGLPTTGGSKAYGSEPASKDAHAVALLRAQGAIVTGKLNTEELAFGIITAPTRNPFDLERIPGGSSGGSAAALAAGMVTLALGSDTAASIRLPAALCGVVGFKPSAGVVSRSGVMPLSTTLDHAGPMARDVASVALLFEELAGYDPDDPQSLPALPPEGEETRRLGVPWSWIETEAARDVLEALRGALGTAEALGYSLVPVDLPPHREFSRLQVKIRGPETFYIHRNAIADRPERFGEGLVERILRGRGTLAEDYVAALEERWALTRRLERDLAAQGVDGLLLPTAPVTAPRSGALEVTLGDGQNAEVRDALIRYTAPFNITGWPAVSIPMGLDRDGLPIGLQIVGRRFEDRRLLRRAAEMESALPAMPWPEPPTA